MLFALVFLCFLEVLDGEETVDSFGVLGFLFCPFFGFEFSEVCFMGKIAVFCFFRGHNTMPDLII